MASEPAPTDLDDLLRRAAGTYPFPIAVACERYLAAAPADPWRQWELLSRDVLQSALHYLSHLLLSDLVALGERPPHLFHRVQAILGRPMAGHYVGFLRETARHYRDAGLEGAFPELARFLVAGEVDESLVEGGGLLGLLVDYRNLWAHGRVDEPAAVARNAERVRELTRRLLEELGFLAACRLEFEDGLALMGSRPAGLGGEAAPLVVIAAGGRSLRPLLVKLKGPDLVLLEEADLSGMKLGFRGGSSYHRFTKKHLKSGDAAALFEELKGLLAKVRSVDAGLPAPEWEDFLERSSIASERTMSRYVDMRKYVPQWYVARPEWEGEEGVFERFMDSGKTLLAISGVQGTGKSALVCRLVDECRSQGHAVLFVNAQRFTFADVAWSGNPYPRYFAGLLHYEGGFDADGLKRLAKSAPEGKRIVLFIDAINEVDGIETKWNRFRAMELMLEWIAGSASSGIKVVLSFRLDAYEEFGYLERKELPANLEEIAWPGTNPRKAWVTDLEPFDETQARGLYEKLNGLPQYGMAPAMTWDEVRSGLGEKTAEFTSNPLLFLVFLMSHNMATKVATRDQDELFMRYAGKLTGSAEAAKRPWWRKVLGFVRNGNITPKEQLLADIIDRMATEGGAAFLVERLEPKKNKRDRRLAAVIDDPRDPTFRDLKEGGLVAEEKIELAKDGEEVTSRRVTFVGELMVTAMEGVVEKLKRLKKFRGLLLNAAMVVAFLTVVALVLAVVRMSIAGFCPKWADPVIIEHFMAFMDGVIALIGRVVWIGFVLLLTFMTLDTLLSPESTSTPRRMGMAQTAYIRASEGRHGRADLLLGLLLMTPMVATIVVILYLYQDSNAGEHFFLLFPMAGIIAGLAVFAAPGSQIVFWKIVALPCPARVIRLAHTRVLEELISTRARRLRRRNVLVVLGAAAAFVPFLIWFTRIRPPEVETPPVIGMRNLAGAVLADLGPGMVWRYLGPAQSWALWLMLSVVAGSFFLLSVYVPFASARLHRHFAQHPNLPSKRPQLWNTVTVFWLLMALGALGGLWYLRAIHTPDDIAPLMRIGVPYEGIKRQRGKVTAVDLSDATLEQSDLSVLYRFRFIEKLKLPNQKGLALDVPRLEKLTSLTARADALRGLDEVKQMKTLELLDPGRWLADLDRREKLLVSVKLHIRGECSTLGELPRHALVNKLAMDENVARKVLAPGPRFRPNLELEIRTAGPPRFDWLTSEVAQYVLRLEAPINNTTQNVHLIERLIMQADGLRPSVLTCAASLKWLMLQVREPVTRELLTELRGVVASSLPSLILVEMQGQIGARRHLFSAKAGDDALALIDRLIADPSLLEE